MLRRVFAVALVTVPLLARTVAPVRADDLTRNRLEADVRFLASDALRGRGTPSREIDIAAEYLAAQLRACGWKPANDGSYLQTYGISSYVPSKSRYKVTLAGTELKPEEFLHFFATDPRQPLDGPLQFAGFGIDYPERNVRDYAGRDVRGRVVVVLEGAPTWDPGQGWFGADHGLGKMIAAMTRNARLVVYVTPTLLDPARVATLRKYMDIEQAFLPDFGQKPTSGLGPMLEISPVTFDRTLAAATGHPYAEWQKILKSKPAPLRDLDATARVEIEAKLTAASASNVVAMLPGSDPALNDEWLVLTAHYDHLGAAAGDDGAEVVYNGADDNASGTAAILEIARRLAARPPKRSVLALLVSGEERGLLGSAHYSAHPLVPMDHVVADVNVDMVGRSDGTVQAIDHNAPRLYDLVAALAKQRGIVVEPDHQPSWRLSYLTDSYHFARFDVPNVEFFTGLHDDYHQPGDDADKIHFDELARIVDVMSDVARAYADGAPKPPIVRPEWFVIPQ